MIINIRNIRILTINSFLFLGAIFLLILGNYGTSNGGMEFGGLVYSKYVVLIFLLLTGGILLIQLVFRGKLKFYHFNQLVFQLYLLILILTNISTLQLPQNLTTTLFLIGFSVGWVTMLINAINDESRIESSFRLFLNILYITGILALITGIYSMQVGSLKLGPILIEYNIRFWRMNSWFNASTMLGLFFCAGIYGAYYFLLTTKNYLMKLIHVVVIIGFMVGIGLAGGRTGLVVLFMSFVLLALSKFRIKVKTLLIYLAVTFVSIGMIVYLLQVYGDQFLIFRRLLEGDSSSLGGRSEFLESAIRDLSSANPIEILFGFGSNGVVDALHWPYGAHSGIIRIIMEYGFITAIIHLLLYFFIFRILILRIRKNVENRKIYDVLFLFFSSYFISEFIVIQMYSLEISYIQFLVVLSFYLVITHFDNQKSKVITSDVDYHVQD